MTGKNVVIEAFTELAPEYEKTVDQELREFWGISYRDFVAGITEIASIEEDNVVLDVATGTALIPLKLVNKVGFKGRIVGLDITLSMLKLGQKNLETAESTSCSSLVCASAMSMPFVKRTFDVVICGLGTHHMDVPQMLSEMKRVLKVGGKLILADVGASALWLLLGAKWVKLLVTRRYGPIQNSTRSQAELEAFPNVRTAGKWRKILLKMGFKKIEMTKSKARRPWYPCALTMKAIN